MQKRKKKRKFVWPVVKVLMFQDSEALKTAQNDTRSTEYQTYKLGLNSYVFHCSKLYCFWGFQTPYPGVTDFYS
jgi:hypothetical protein